LKRFYLEKNLQVVQSVSVFWLRKIGSYGIVFWSSRVFFVFKKKQINRKKFNYRSLMMAGCVCDSSEVMMDDGFGDSSDIFSFCRRGISVRIELSIWLEIERASV